jgi:excisionase family DNA binding protein
MAADPGSARGGQAPGAPVPAERLGELRFLTVAEVATLMRVSKMTVYRLVNAATLPAVRVGRSVRVPEQAVHDYLQHSYVEAG